MAVPQSSRIAVVGGGLAGLSCAQRLRSLGHAVEVLDKGRGPGGRVCTRHDGEAGNFDHGAQFVTAREPEFEAWLSERETDGSVVLATWRLRRPGRSAGERLRFVGQPGMSAIPAALATGLTVHRQVRVVRLERRAAQWHLGLEEGGVAGPFDAVVLAVPAPQAAPLLQEPAPELAAAATRARLAPCWAVMAAWDQLLEVTEDAWEPDHPVLAWAAREASKQGRAPGERWVLHGSAGWSEAHLEDDAATVGPALLAAFAEVTGCDMPPPTLWRAHRWRYARVTTPLGVNGLLDAEQAVAACGDWCRGPRVEDAWLSGWHTALLLHQALSAHDARSSA